jgi:L-iditol 2-dehydrogenase
LEAVLIHGIRDIRVGSHPQPAGRRNDGVLLAVEAVGLCGSDLHYYVEGSTGGAHVSEPFVPGHEFSARVAEDRPDLGLRAGQLVAVDPAKPCNRCEWCRRGHANLCPEVEFTGAPPFHGAMTTAPLRMDAHQIIPVPDSFTPDEAMMLEPLGVTIHAMDLAKLGLGETVAILGCGPIGLGILQLAKLTGASRIYAIDPVADRTARALSFGADAVAAGPGAVAEWTNGRGVDCVVEATNARSGLSDAAEAVAIGGRIVLVGIPEGDRTEARASTLRRKGVTIKLSRRMGDVYPRAIDLVARRRVDVGALISHRFALADAPKAFQLGADCADGAIKSVIYPTANPAAGPAA